MYFHIIEVKNHRNGITIIAISTVDLKIQGHMLCCVTFLISLAGFVLSERSRCLFHILQIRGHELLCVIFYILGCICVIEIISMSIFTSSGSRICLDNTNRANDKEC